MKKILSILIAAASVLLMASCSKFNEAENVAELSEGELVPVTISVESPAGYDVETKSLTSYTDKQDYETAIYNLQVLFVNKSTNETIFLKVDDISELSSKKYYFRNNDEYRYIAIANYYEDLSSCTSIADVQKETFKLTGDEKTKGFVFSTTSSFSPTSSHVISFSSFHTSRVCLAYVKNNIPSDLGDFELVGAFLSNATGSQTFAQSAPSFSSGDDNYTGWINWHGRLEHSATSAQIIDGSTYTAQLPDLTYKSYSQTLSNGESYQPSTPDLFYSLANISSFSDHAYLKLVIMGKLNGVLQYYPVTFKSLMQGHSISVGVTLNGYGSLDPEKTPSTISTTFSTSANPTWYGDTGVEQDI